MSLTWSNPPSRAFPELSDAYVAAIRRGVRAIADRRAPQIEAWMKDNAPWTDRTSIARQTLTAKVEQVALDMIEIQLRSGAEYIVYLETIAQGRWAIITPAVDLFGPRIWADVRAMLS